MLAVKPNADELIRTYVALRDKIRDIEKAHVEQLRPYREALAYREANLLEALDRAGLQHMKSPHGTAFKSVRTSAKVVDWPATLGYIREREAWDLLEARVSKTAAVAITEDTKQPIPGVEISSELTINVRRPTA